MKDKIDFRLQCHADHNEDELKQFWADTLEINSKNIDNNAKIQQWSISWPEVSFVIWAAFGECERYFFQIAFTRMD